MCFVRYHDVTSVYWCGHYFSDVNLICHSFSSWSEDQSAGCLIVFQPVLTSFHAFGARRLQPKHNISLLHNFTDRTWFYLSWKAVNKKLEFVSTKTPEKLHLVYIRHLDLINSNGNEHISRDDNERLVISTKNNIDENSFLYYTAFKISE